MGHSPLAPYRLSKGGVSNCWPMSTTFSTLWFLFIYFINFLTSYPTTIKRGMAYCVPTLVESSFLANFSLFFLGFSYNSSLIHYKQQSYYFFFIILLYLPWINYNPKPKLFMQTSFHKDYGKSLHTKNISHFQGEVTTYFFQTWVLPLPSLTNF
jgi:hypothetical protein